MRYAGLIKNDIASASGICVSFFTQGCPFRCYNCHNPESWDYNGGKEFTNKTIKNIIDALQANGIHRNLSIMGGEPLCSTNIKVTKTVIENVLEKLPDTLIYIWTGHVFEDLLEIAKDNNDLQYILNHTECIIDGKYIDELRDVTLYMRGSSNQRVIDVKKTLDKNEIVWYNI